jgi:hypothetical protein
VPTLRHSGTRDEVGVTSADARRPVLLATLDVPFAEDATVFAVDSAVESGQPLVVVNAAEIHPTRWSLLGYGYIEKEDLQSELVKPAELAHSLAVREVVAERRPGVLVFGPDRSRLRRRTYERAAKRIREKTSCLVWLAPD